MNNKKNKNSEFEEKMTTELNAKSSVAETDVMDSKVGTDAMSSDEYNDYEDDRAYYEIPDDDDDENEHPKKDPHPILFLLLFKLLISPRVGWRDIRRAKLKADYVCQSLFYPLIALASAANFVNLFYDAERTITGEVINAIVTFASFFFSYFLVFPFGKLLLKGKGTEVIVSEFGRTYVAFAMSSLCIFFFLYLLLPMLEPILVLLPLWTIFLITRGIKILRIPEEDDTSATIWLSLLIVGLPVGVSYLFGLILRL